MLHHGHANDEGRTSRGAGRGAVDGGGHQRAVAEDPALDRGQRSPHQGKIDLLDKLPAKLKGYSSWIPETWRIIVIVDRDDQDCEELKQQLEAHAGAAGLATRSTTPANTPWVVVNRLAIEELEAWYFGDWDAVRAAFPKVAATLPAKAGFRDPDRIKGGTWEAFERVLQQAGYFPGGLPKIAVARVVAPHMVPARNRSRSFQVLQLALQDLDT